MLALEDFGEYQLARQIVMGAVVILVGIVIGVLIHMSRKNK